MGGPRRSWRSTSDRSSSHWSVAARTTVGRNLYLLASLVTFSPLFVSSKTKNRPPELIRVVAQPEMESARSL